MGSPNTNDLFQIGKLNTTGEGASPIIAKISRIASGATVGTGATSLIGFQYSEADPYYTTYFIPSLDLVGFKILESGYYDIDVSVWMTASGASVTADLIICYWGSQGEVSATTTGTILSNSRFFMAVVGATVTNHAYARKVFLEKGVFIAFYCTNQGSGTVTIESSSSTTAQASIQLICPAQNATFTRL